LSWKVVGAVSANLKHWLHAEADKVLAGIMNVLR
jgi:hypothetical protein